jgi:hypothetical protein
VELSPFLFKAAKRFCFVSVWVWLVTEDLFAPALGDEVDFSG